jgi:pyruvate carboxylase
MGGILVANRGEIAIRIARAAGELGIRAVGVYARDDAGSLHTRRADEARELPGEGVAAYLDGEQLIAAAKAAGCTAIHPGYGFLSENAAFARGCAAEGITFVGPGPELLELFGDKLAARDLAERLGVPVLPGTRAGAASLDGRKVLLGVDDFTVRGGSGDAAIHAKQVYAEEYARQMRLPIVRLLDGASGGGSVRMAQEAGRLLLHLRSGQPLHQSGL